MASINSLPNELLSRIVSRVEAKADIASLRLINRTLNAVATEAYFASVPLYAHWWGYEHPECCDPEGYVPFPNCIKYDARIFKNILDSDHLKKLVKKVDIWTCNPDCDHDPHWSTDIFGGGMSSDQLADIWYECLDRLLELENLRSVSIIFDRHGANGDEDDYDNEEILHNRGDREAMVKKVARLLGTRIQDLSIRHHQEYPKPKDSDDDSDDGSNASEGGSESMWAGILGGLRSLRMSVVHEQARGESGSTLKIGDSHQCWAQFSARWLLPAAQNLKHLTLYSDLPTGWFPKLDLRGVHFANLESLALGQFMFSHDWQIDWILSHHSTLRGIYLDHCSILYQVGHASLEGKGWINEEGYPIEDNEWGVSILPQDKDWRSGKGFQELLTYRSYGLRWHDVFTRFSISLPYLRTFRFGSSKQWNFEVENRRDDSNPGMPIMPWEDEVFIRNELFRERYLHYNDWEQDYGVRWEENFSGDLDFHNRDWVGGMEGPPECGVEDEAALRALLEKMDH